MADEKPDEIIRVVSDGIELHFIGPQTIELGVWLKLDTLEPIEWTPFNEWAFLRGAMMVQEMTREDFAKRYGK